MSRLWYAYMGSGSYSDPHSYTRSVVTPTCRNGAHLCAVFATEGPTVGCPPGPGPYPLFISTNIQSYIASGLVQIIPTPQPPPPDVAYVYFKA
ncbi:hypothetical protein HDE70_003706 [Pedobacter cryoconitis]|nr:hypothetical protein [Pedobacter cryoconitis]